MQTKETHTDKKNAVSQEMESNAAFAESVNYGVSPDSLNYGKLFGLVFVGIIVVVGLVFTAKTMFNYFSFQASQKAAVNAVFYDLEDLTQKHQQTLTTFGVVDEQAGIYRVPVDSAITLIVQEYNNP
jgi:hypothetical protein